MKVTVIVAVHKKYRMPEDTCYLPLHVGKEGKEEIGFVGDNTGDNISLKNPYYCELTGLYWMWKNVEADYLGLVHYRRYFATSGRKKGKDKFEQIFTEEEMKSLLAKNDIILPKKRRYFIENLYSHYAHTHYAEHLDCTKEILKERCPEYASVFETVMKRTYGHMFNMFIMSREKCDAYCRWLFPILYELENRIDFKEYNAFQARLFGRVSELLLDVWMEKNGYEYQEVPVVSMEPVNWIHKGTSFFKGKVFRKKI